MRMRARRVYRPPVATLDPQTATVSVIVTCYNYGRYLEQCVSSVVNQSDVSVEVVVVDDASSDGSLAVARDLARADTRVRLLASPVNLGPAGAFNLGWRAAKGRYVVRLDADDLLVPGSLARAAAVLESSPGVAFVYGKPLHFFNDDVPIVKARRLRWWTIWEGRSWFARRCERAYSCITSPEVMMRMSALKTVDGMNEHAHAHDFDLWLRLSLVGDVAHLKGPVQALHREHADSLSARELDHARDLEERAAVFQQLAAGDDRDAAFCAGRGLTRLARESLQLACRQFDRFDEPLPLADQYAQRAAMWDAGFQDLAEWTALARRQRLGPTLTKRLGLGVSGSVKRRCRATLYHYRWRYTGL